MLILLLVGMISYGGYFWLAHSVQQLANDGARAALAGLDESERSTLANASVRNGLAGYAYLVPAKTAVSVEGTSQELIIQVNYDASTSPAFALKDIVPMPSTTIRRQAVVRLGGY